MFHGSSIPHQKCRDKSLYSTNESESTLGRIFQMQCLTKQGKEGVELAVKVNTACFIAKEDEAPSPFAEKEWS